MSLIDDAISTIILPDAPDDQRRVLDGGGVACWSSEVWIDTYDPAEPDRYPMFLDRRVYQGSSGRVYPIPFTDRVSDTKVPRAWQAIHLENEYVRLMLLPEIGGRIHIGFDKTAGYDFFYRNNVIKPALVALAGPWVSGGVEFNWPQHHRPATFLPVETCIEREEDGSVVVWHSDLDPLQRMRGTHGIRLRPGSSLIEADVRLHNRTDEPQTFLWWANVAARVHEDYQSFFPTDVGYVADHARRAVSAFPAADRPYYGVDYPALARAAPGADRLDRYSNIPVPTSYMVTDTADEFFGGYDHAAEAGFVHWAERSIAPGKKQWTWGDGAVGRAWDEQLTDTDGPYVELMAGVFTDNQPDFSYLAPGETRCFSQYWYPIRLMGPASQANLRAAVSLVLDGDTVRVGASATAAHSLVTVQLRCEGALVQEWHAPLGPAHPFSETATLAAPVDSDDVEVRILDGADELISWRSRAATEVEEPRTATEPPPPEDIASADELYLTAVHLEQYRHPTRSSLPYLQRLLEDDPGDSRANIALGAWHYRRGEYAAAQAALETAVVRLSSRNLNPYSGEAGYRLGLVRERRGDLDGADVAFGKAAWDAAWAAAAMTARARISLRQGRIRRAGEIVDAAERQGHDLFLARVLVTRSLDPAAAHALVRARRHADPLDPLARALDEHGSAHDDKMVLQIAADLAAGGALTDALQLTAHPFAPAGARGNAEPMRRLLRAVWLERMGAFDDAALERRAVHGCDLTYAFPYGLDEYDALCAAQTAVPEDHVVAGLLGAWLLDAGRLEDALDQLRHAAAHGATDPVVWRNLAVATVNAGHDLVVAEDAFARALALSPGDQRLLFERDLLARLRGLSAEDRLAQIDLLSADVLQRDDLALVVTGLLVDTGRIEEAEELLAHRRFHPFEGGEGAAIAAFDRVSIARARRLLASNPAEAARLLETGLIAPAHLGEGRHPASPIAERQVLIADACSATGDGKTAAHWLRQAVEGAGTNAVDPRPLQPDDYWVGIAHARLGRPDLAENVWVALEARACELEGPKPLPDYFATSLPELLLFDVDTPGARSSQAEELRDLARRGRTIRSEEAAP